MKVLAVWLTTTRREKARNGEDALMLLAMFKKEMLSLSLFVSLKFCCSYSEVTLVYCIIGIEVHLVL